MSKKTIQIEADAYTGYLPDAGELRLFGEGFGLPTFVQGAQRLGARGSYYERRSATIATPPVEVVAELPPHVTVIPGDTPGLEVDPAALAAAEVAAGVSVLPLSADTAARLDPSNLRVRARLAASGLGDGVSVLAGLARYDAEAERWDVLGAGIVGTGRSSAAGARHGGVISIGDITSAAWINTSIPSEVDRLRVEVALAPDPVGGFHGLRVCTYDFGVGVSLPGQQAQGDPIPLTLMQLEEIEAFLSEATPALIVLDSTGEDGHVTQFFDLLIA